MSRELPILFNTDMVRAILVGRKTVTRRLVKPQPDWFDCGLHNDRNTPMKAVAHPGTDWQIKQPCQVGDILYVRETWKVMCARRFDACVDIEYKAGGKKRILYPYSQSQLTNRDKYDNFIRKWWNREGWHPSIHMPKEVARIFLRVTDVRVERLQTINDIPDEAVKEGTKETFPPLAEDEFVDIWNATIPKEDLCYYGWDANPWVWVIEFERCEKPVEYKPFG